MDVGGGVASAANMTARLQGDVGLGDRAPARLAYTLRSSDISPLLQTAGHQGGGELTLNGHLGGDFSNLEASGNLTFAALKVDKYGATRAVIKYDVHKPAHEDQYGLVS